MIRKIEIQRLTIVSTKAFEAVVAAVENGIGRPDMLEFGRASSSANTYAELENLVNRSVSELGLMLFMKLDIGAVLRKESGLVRPKAQRFIIDNPLIMKEMVKDGLRIWNAAIAHAGPRVIGLDGVVAQQQNYRKSGFELAYANVRYGGIVAAPNAPQAGAIALTGVPLAAVEACDATVFPAPRTAFLRAWIGSPGHVGRAFVRDGRLAGWGVIRPCRKGRKIGPLVADDRATAEVVLSALLASGGGGEIFLDVPSINRDAVALAQDLGLAPVFETARMYTSAIPPLRLERVFGVTTFELG